MNTPVLLIIDVQRRFDDPVWGVRNNLAAEANIAFIGTGPKDLVRAASLDTLSVAGLTTDHSVSTSVRMAANLGFSVTLVSDATATFDRVGVDGVVILAEEIHRIHLASLQGEFCTVESTEKVLRVVA